MVAHVEVTKVPALSTASHSRLLTLAARVMMISEPDHRGGIGRPFDESNLLLLDYISKTYSWDTWKKIVF